MISVKDIENLATLSRLTIDENEKSQLVKEIDSILAYVDQIKNVKKTASSGEDFSADDIESRVGSVKNVMRTDEARTISPADRERILAEAPDREGDFVAVKKIL